MADAITSLVVEKLFNFLSEEAIFLYKVRSQVEWLIGELRTMQTFLQDAEERQRNNTQIIEWMRDVCDVAYDAEDTVKTYILNYQRRQRAQGFIMHIKRCLSFPCQLMIHHDIGLQIKDIKNKIDDIKRRKETYGIQAIENQHPCDIHILVEKRRERALRADVNVVVGFEDKVEEIVRLLVDEQNKQLSVISIFGMGGSGKTTLARRVRNHDLVKSSFRLYSASASVSQTYNDIKIFRDIAKDILDKERVKDMDDEEMKDELFVSLKTQRYLILLDDIWKPEHWTDIQSHFPNVKNGSRLIITTRSEEVAQFASPSIPPHKMRSLTEDESWELFCKIAFPHEDASTICTGELERLGKTAIERCEGLPLAVAVMAGFVSTRPRNPAAWREALHRIDWDRIPNGQVCMEILSLSFKSLPPYLKPCFMYLGCFPEDSTIVANDTKALWIAEGFVIRREEDRGKSELEDVAEQWLEELNRRCLLHNVERLYDGGCISEFQIHDLLLDLCRKKARELNFFHTQGQGSEVERLSVPRRRLALYPGEDDREYNISPEVWTPKMRTLHAFGKVPITVPYLQQMAKLLRVINLKRAGCRELPEAIGGLFHLRYLGLGGNQLRSIPSSVGNLLNLQTLDVRWNHELTELPKSVWGICSLRHMWMKEEIEPAVGCGGRIKSVKVRTLLYVKAGGWIRVSLATMRNLRALEIGSLSVEHHAELADALDHLLLLLWLGLRGEHIPRKALALPNHRHLEVLRLTGVLVESSENSNYERPTYTSDELPPNLYLFCLRNSELQQDPFTLLGELPYLKTLHLWGNVYDGEELACSADSRFPQLKELKLEDLGHSIRRWRWEQGTMPCLGEVTIRNCDSLEVVTAALPDDGMRNVKINGMPVEEFLVDQSEKRSRQ